MVILILLFKLIKKLSHRLETGRQQWSFYRRNDIYQRPTPTSSESADLLRIQRMNFNYAKMHATTARGLTRDRTVVRCLLFRETCEYQ